jgi:hypothetical protein
MGIEKIWRIDGFSEMSNFANFFVISCLRVRSLFWFRLCRVGVNRDGRRVLEVFKVLGVGIGAKVFSVLSGGAFRLAGGGARTLRTARPQRRTRRTKRTPRQPGLFMTKG